ncbi:FecR family protein [Mucilaginibacter lappiensis]|uniref:Ferric-dicitrate binding protein FerR (Iron transport regulator) n=1 Tax=Mucilaginibacter lappiensis TaxID=354630 RepID=A0ABR6PDN1_9SPHI|nr:FecR domain-containing protein [Mucilaginibacter lappiensis]MBB6107811.1 ferric-dicitrate binding protein FerR (iron transport regulator) [Mucilaginibacter lappiensis]SIP96401.1 FecR family protein [Mucilaginibacter lappiensis]
MENKSAIIELFVKYLQNRCSPDEVKQLLKYFETEQDEESLRHLINAELNFEQQGTITNSREDAVLLKIKSALIAEIREDNVQQPRKILPVIPRWLKVAAFWLLVSALAAVLFNDFLFTIKKNAVPVKLSIIKTARSERKQIVLFDGTKIWLSPSSTLEFPDQLIGNFREIKLEGEAFFEVAKDKIHPFIIHSDHMDTRVVGTSFEVQTYQGQTNYKVTVVTGIVKVSGLSFAKSTREEVTLHPNQQSLFNKNNGTLKSIAYPNAQMILKRKDGILNYDSASVNDVVSDFSRYYNLQIDIENKSKSCLFSGEFDTKKPISIVLEQLAVAINANVIFQDGRYILKGGCSE